MKIGSYELTMPRQLNNWTSQTTVAYTNQIQSDPTKRKLYKKSLIWFLISLIGFVGYDPLVNTAIDSQLQLKPDGLVTGIWQVTPLPVNTCWYIWGMQNPWEFLSGAKPYMVDHGPFCYYMYRKRRILEWREQTVLFMERYEFEPNPKDSKLLETRIQTVNAPILAGVMLAKSILENFYLNFLGPVVYNAINMVMRATGEDLVEVITARQLMEGRKMRIIEYADMIMAPVRWLGISAPDFTNGTFFGISNHSVGITSSIPFLELGPYEAYRRTEKGHTVGHIHQYQGRHTYPTYEAPCNRLAGGDGMFFSRPVTADKLHVFVQHTCRTLPFIKDYPHMVAGTSVVRYTMDPDMFNMDKPENQCNCIKGRTIEECDGWSDMGPCALTLPLGFSFPHFYGSQKRQEEFEGLEPDKDKHVGYLEVEDNLGAPIFASMKIQAVLTIEPIWSVPSLSSIPKIKLPVFWVDLAGGAEGVLSGALAVVSNTVRYGSYASFLGCFAYSALLFRRGQRALARPRSVEGSPTPPPQQQQQQQQQTSNVKSIA
ncbi:cd36 [Tyrophagus putrescentiae]|nr:cd36 [Tyrophagus putrescentiae]